MSICAWLEGFCGLKKSREEQQESKPLCFEYSVVAEPRDCPKHKGVGEVGLLVGVASRGRQCQEFQAMHRKRGVENNHL